MGPFSVSGRNPKCRGRPLSTTSTWPGARSSPQSSRGRTPSSSAACTPTPRWRGCFASSWRRRGALGCRPSRPSGSGHEGRARGPRARARAAPWPRRERERTNAGEPRGDWRTLNCSKFWGKAVTARYFSAERGRPEAFAPLRC